MYAPLHGMSGGRPLSLYERMPEARVYQVRTGHIARQCTFGDPCKVHHARGACICAKCDTHLRKNEFPHELCTYWRRIQSSATLKSAALGSLHRHAPHVAQVRIKHPEHSIVRSTNVRHARANSNQKAIPISTAHHQVRLMQAFRTHI